MSRSYRAPFLVRLISFLVPRLKSGATPRTFRDAIPPGSIEPSETPLTRAMHAASSPESSGAFDLMRDLNKAVEADCFKNHLWRVCTCPGCEGIRTKMGAERHKARKEFGQRETPPAKRPRLGPMPYFMPDAMRDGHTMERAKSEGWETLAILDGHEWAKRCRDWSGAYDRATLRVGELSMALDQERERVAILDSKRQDQEARISLLESQLDMTCEALDNECAERLRERERANMWESRAEAVLAAVEFCLDLEATNAGDAVVWLKEWTEGDTVAEEELQNWRSANAKRTAELPGTAVSNGNGLQPVPPVVGCERPEPAAVRPASPTPSRPDFETYQPRTADMAAVVEAQGRNLPGPCPHLIRVWGGIELRCANLTDPRCATCPKGAPHHRV